LQLQQRVDGAHRGAQHPVSLHPVRIEGPSFAIYLCILLNPSFVSLLYHFCISASGDNRRTFVCNVYILINPSFVSLLYHFCIFCITFVSFVSLLYLLYHFCIFCITFVSLLYLLHHFCITASVLRPIAENTFADHQIAEFQFADFLFAKTLHYTTPNLT
jgi:hypothetical protein